jgi:hypothetical protein
VVVLLALLRLMVGLELYKQKLLLLKQKLLLLKQKLLHRKLLRLMVKHVLNLLLLLKHQEGLV